MSEPARVVRLTEALAVLPLPATAKWPDGTWYHTLFDQPGLQILMFAPKGTDYQTPHARDEAYFVMRGSAMLEMGETLTRVASGDMVWVPKMTRHRFTDISDDFAAWVVFIC